MRPRGQCLGIATITPEYIKFNTSVHRDNVASALFFFRSAQPADKTTTILAVSAFLNTSQDVTQHEFPLGALLGHFKSYTGRMTVPIVYSMILLEYINVWQAQQSVSLKAENELKLPLRCKAGLHLGGCHRQLSRSARGG